MIEPPKPEWPTLELRWDGNDQKVYLRLLWPQRVEDHEVSPTQLLKLAGQATRLLWANFTVKSRYGS